MEDFINSYKNEYSKKTQNEKENESTMWDNSSLLGEYYDNYNQARKDRGDKSMSYNDFTKKISDMVGRVGVIDGKWSQEDYESGAFRDNDDYQKYTKTFLDTTMGGINPWRGGTDQEIGKYAPQEVKDAYNRIKNNSNKQWGIESISDRSLERHKDDVNWLDAAGSAFGDFFDTVGSGIATVWNAPYNMGQKDVDVQTVEKYLNQQKESSISMFDNFDDYLENYKKTSAEKKEQSASESGDSGDKTTAGSTSNSDSSTDDDTVTFTLPSANDPNYRGFGQKIVDLGIATDKGLWGADGDVAFYTKQLYDQGALDARGNLKIGVPIKLKKRK